MIDFSKHCQALVSLHIFPLQKLHIIIRLIDTLCIPSKINMFKEAIKLSGYTRIHKTYIHDMNLIGCLYLTYSCSNRSFIDLIPLGSFPDSKKMLWTFFPATLVSSGNFISITSPKAPVPNTVPVSSNSGRRQWINWLCSAITERRRWPPTFLESHTLSSRNRCGTRD